MLNGSETLKNNFGESRTVASEERWLRPKSKLVLRGPVAIEPYLKRIGLMLC